MRYPVALPLDELFRFFSPREEQIIRMRLGIREQKMPVKQIAREFGLSTQRIYAIYNRSMGKLHTRKFYWYPRMLDTCIRNLLV